MPIPAESFARLATGHLVWVESVAGGRASVVLLERYPAAAVSVRAAELVVERVPLHA